MKQVRRRLGERGISIAEVPTVPPPTGFVQVRVLTSLISSGTERSKADLAERTLFGKALARPDAARDVISSVKSRGFRETAAAVRGRLSESESLGYSCAGVVVGVGEGVVDLRPQMRVACAGAGYAVHAEIVNVPSMLTVPMPDGLDFEPAAFVAIGAIALHGIRQAETDSGGRLAVIGLGLVGQLVCRIAAALGLEVFGFDPRIDRVELGLAAGVKAFSSAEDLVKALRANPPVGADGVVISAATISDEPIALAGELARDRGTVVVLGDVGTRFPRKIFYEKELQVRLSRSYGPGRYDRQFEEVGIDYPVGFVRWTERRNMELFLSLMAKGRVDVRPLISHRFPLESATDAYEVLRTDTSALAIVIRRGEDSEPTFSLKRPSTKSHPQKGRSLGILAVGCGNFANRVLFPHLSQMKDVSLVAVSSQTGLSAVDAAEQFGFRSTVQSAEEGLSFAEVAALVVSTRHDSHPKYAIQGLEAGRSVFIEKPLSLNWQDLNDVSDAVSTSEGVLWVGFNRRFAPATRWIVDRLSTHDSPRSVSIRVNAGELNPDHWLLDPHSGGGRLLGEGCHFVDLALGLVDSEPAWVVAAGADSYGNRGFSILLSFTDGSTASIDYATGGDAHSGKERVEVFAGGKTFGIDDFRVWWLSIDGKTERVRKPRQEKGHKEGLIEFVQSAIRGHRDVDLLRAFFLSSAVTLAAADSLRLGKSVVIPRVAVEP